MDSNADVARALYELGALTGRSGGPDGRHRARAYRRAAAAIAASDVDVLAADEAGLTAIPGVGAGTAARIAELRRTGRIAALDQLRAADPAGVEALLAVPGIGPVTAARLRDQLAIRDVDDLRAALHAGRLGEVHGVGPGTVARIAEGLAHVAPDGGPPRLPIGVAVEHAEQAADALSRLDGVDAVGWAGELARMRDTVAVVELLVRTDDPDGVLAATAALPSVREVVGRGRGGRVRAGRAGVAHVDLATFDGPVVRVHAVDPGCHPVAAVRLAADDAHHRALTRRAEEEGLRLGEDDRLRTADGAAVPLAAPADLYRALGLPTIPPEQRDGTDEVALALAGRLPRGADVDDLRGDLHDHTDFSGDGRMSVVELLDAAAARGWEYLGITDHAEDLTINGLSREMVLRQRRVLAGLADRHPGLAVLQGAELNIGPDGGVDYDPDFLAGYGWAVASVHSHFRLDAATQTRRLVTAIRNPAVRAIGHLTGRRIGRRPGIELDVDAVLDACLETGTAIEANCHLDRFDAPAEVLAEAASRGVLVTISTDAHHVGELGQHRWGVALARRGRVPAELVVNTWPQDRFLAWAARP